MIKLSRYALAADKLFGGKDGENATATGFEVLI
jgi:hypothetical protein